MKERVVPEKGGYKFRKNNIGRMFLLYMEQFMAKDLLTIPAVERQLIVPENRPEKGEWGTWLPGRKEF